MELSGQPLTTYSGGIPELPATKPAPGTRLEPRSAAARAYRDHLSRQRQAVLGSAGLSRVDRVFDTALDGFAARLTPAQVSALRADPRVRSVTESRFVTYPELDRPVARGWVTDRTLAAAPAAGGSGAGTAGDSAGESSSSSSETAATAVREALQRSAQDPTLVSAAAGEASRGPGVASTGRDVVIGVVDTGIWPESPSFAAKLPAPSGWRGVCQGGEVDGITFSCNGKVVGARFFATGALSHFGGSLPQTELLSARDLNGHGTHTASTAAGGPISHTLIDGRDYGAISGVAPDARIAVYKALWNGGGADEDIAAAIDAAVADGVQVINFSVGNGGAEVPLSSPIATAMRNAAQAGVFIAAAGGNTGSEGMVDNAFPWVTTVAAVASRRNEGLVRLGDGRTLVGMALDDLGSGASLPVAYGAGPDPTSARNCGDGTLDAAAVRGRVVVCRGTGGSLPELRAKGAAGVVLFQPLGGPHLSAVSGMPLVNLPTSAQADILLQYLNAHPKDARIALLPGSERSSGPDLPSVAEFSSRGPDAAHPGLLKPDLAAEGVDVLAAVSPVGAGRNFDALSGTSMAAPHVAGMASVLKAVHPDWSPSAISSALRTTAGDTRGTTDPYQQGNGLADLSRALDPGVVFDSGSEEWARFAADAQPDGRDLNLPAISLRQYDATRPVTLTRRLRSVGDQRETYTVEVSGLSGTSVTVTPATVTLDPGQTASVQITVSRGTAAWDSFDRGTITWTGSRHVARIPIVARAWGVIRWCASCSEGSYDWLRIWQDGTAPFQVGFTGTLKARTTGFATPTWQNFQLTAGDDGEMFHPSAPGVRAHRVVVPAGTAALALLVDAASDPDNTVQTYLYRDGQLLRFGNDAYQAPDEVTLVDPKPGTYTLYVQSHRPTPEVVRYRLGTVMLPRTADLGNATVSVPTDVRYYDNVDVVVKPAKGVSLPAGSAYAYVDFSVQGTFTPGLLIRN